MFLGILVHCYPHQRYEEFYPWCQISANKFYKASQFKSISNYSQMSRVIYLAISDKAIESQVKSPNVIERWAEIGRKIVKTISIAQLIG